jgi:Flp pilus assembly protein CpaB
VRRRSNLLVLLGVAFFVVGGVIVYLLTDDDGGTKGTGEAAPVSVVVGTEDIPAGALADDLIEAGKLKAIETTTAALTPGAIQSLNQLAGAEFVQGFAANQQITSSGLQLRNRTFEIPEGYEAVALQIDFVPGAAGYVNAGDHINLYGLYTTPVADRPAPRAELLLTNVEVLDVDLSIPARRGTAGATDPSQPAAQRASGSAVTYLLALRTDDAEKVIYTTEFASFYATLTGDEAPPAGPTPGRDAENILEEEPNAAFAG